MEVDGDSIVLNIVRPMRSLYEGWELFGFVFDGVVIAAQCTAIFQDLLCSPEFRYY